MHQDYRLLVAFRERIRRGLYRRRLVQGGILLCTILLALLLLGVGVQALVPAVPLLAPVYSLLAVLVGLAAGRYVVLPALRPVSQRQAVVSCEQTYPDLHDDLTNALELDAETLERANPHGIALGLVRALHQQTARKVQQSPEPAVVRRQPLHGLSWCGMVVVATALVAIIEPRLLGHSLQLLFTPFSSMPPRQIDIALTPQHAIIPQGTNLEIQAEARGRQPRSMSLLISRQGEADKRYPMEAMGAGRFRYTSLKPPTSFTFRATAHGSFSPLGTVEVVPAPAIGRIALRYLFPAYTGLPARLQEGGGDIQALPGTQVQLNMQANVPLAKGVLRFDGGTVLPLTVAETALEGGILVTRDGTYVIDIEDTHGLHNVRPPRYSVQVLADRHPQVEIIKPQDGSEVDETTVLQVQYQVQDDFGLQDAVLVYFAPTGAEHRITLHAGRFEPRQAQETFAWDMHQWPLPAGDTVQFFIEVYDNDTISGPKKGVSQTLTLKVRNRAEEHQDLARLQEATAEALLEQLADYLELADQLQAWRADEGAGEPPSPEALRQLQERQHAARERSEQISQDLDELLERLRQDPYSTYETFANVQALQRNMSALHAGPLPHLHEQLEALAPTSSFPAQLERVAQPLEETIREMERLASLADQSTSGQKLTDLMQIGTKMMEEQNKLLAALGNLPDNFSGGELPAELQKMLEDVDRLMQDLLAAMSRLPSTLPDEFLNTQIENLSLSDMMQQLQELRQLLQAGDIEGARQRAEALLKALSAMVAALQNMQQQAGGPLEAMGQQLQESANRLAELVQRQERLLEDTQRLDQQALQQLNQAQQHAYEAALPRLEQRLNELSRLSWELSGQARQHPDLAPAFQQAYQELLKQLHALRKDFKTRDMPQVEDDLQAAERQLAWMQRQAEGLPQPDQTFQQQVTQALEHLQAMRRELGRMPQNRQAVLGPAQRRQLGALAEEQESVHQDTQALQQAFESLLPLMPFLPTEMGQHVSESLPFMAQAHSELVQRHSQQAIPPEQTALDHLRRAQNSLQQALQEMAQRSQMMGMSLPMLRQAGRFPMPFMAQPDVSQQQAGAAGANVRNFQLPDKEAYKVPRMFREDIVEALKEGYPERYKELIEQYYRNIVR